jgi:CDGSH-type Zn-finger protein
MSKQKTKTVITAKLQATRLAKEQFETPRLCTCGSGEEAYLCNGLPEEGWAYCG